MSKVWIIIIMVVLAFGGAVRALIVYATGGSESQSESSAERIRIEIRAKPTAKIRIDGKQVGETPMNLQFPKSSRQIEIEATMTEEWYQPGLRQPRIRTYTPKRKVTLDHDQIVDFTRKSVSD